MFHRTPFFLPWLYPNLIWRIPTLNKELYLTFDDGPIPGPTDFVLETLRSFSIQATFFCIGDNIRKHPDIFKKMLAEDHTVCNHTFHHLNGWKTPADQFINDVQACGNIMNTTANCQLPTAYYLRPPYGRITREQIRQLQSYKIIMWDVLTYDYSKNISPEKCLQGSIGAARMGSIIVFHDSLKAEKNMTYSLPKFIEHFIGEGYTFKSLP